MKRILGVILIVIGLLIYVFFKSYNGELIPYTTLWFFVGVAIAIIGVWMFYTGKSKVESEAEVYIKKQIELLKSNGEIIDVKFRDCEIIANNYSEQIPVNYKKQSWDNLLSYRSFENVDVNISRLIYKVKNSNGEFTYVSPLIYMDKINLQFALGQQDKTQIYVDKNDKSLYYFDLEFLIKN